MKIDAEALKVAEGEKLSLADRPTGVAPLFESKEDYEQTLKEHAKELEKRHERL